MDDVRITLLRLAGEKGQSLAELSRMLRRNEAYLQQFVHRGTPRRLAEDDRRLLAAHFGVDETALGGTAAAQDIVEVPFLVVRAAAGGGLAAEDERVLRTEPFAARLLRDVGVTPRHATLVTATGDSMEPGILGGDRLLVDRGDTAIIDGAIHVFRRGGAVAVKRLARVPVGVRIVSDNESYLAEVVDPYEIAVIGRVKLLLRQPR